MSSVNDVKAISVIGSLKVRRKAVSAFSFSLVKQTKTRFR